LNQRNAPFAKLQWRAPGLLLFAPTNRTPRPAPGSGVCSRSLTPRRHPAPMAHTSIAANVHQSLDIHRDFPPEIALNSHFFIDDFAQAVDLVVGQIPHPRIRIDVRSLEKMLARMESNTVDVWQSRLDPLISR
jgi:hypothetical protein